MYFIDVKTTAPDIIGKEEIGVLGWTCFDLLRGSFATQVCDLICGQFSAQFCGRFSLQFSGYFVAILWLI